MIGATKSHAAVRRTEQPVRGGLSDRTLAMMLVAPAALLLLGFSVYPFIQAGWDSFYRIPLQTGESTWVGLHNYQEVLRDPAIRAALGRTIVWTITNVVVQTVLGVIMALVLNQKLRGRDMARGLVLFPYMVPAIVVAMVFRFTFNDITGIVGYLLNQVGVQRPPLFLADPTIAMWTVVAVNCWKYTPFITIIVLARLHTVPQDLYEATKIDGASSWQSFWAVTMPWVRPVLLVALLLRTIWTINDFDLIYLLAFGGPLSATTTLPIEIHALAFGQQDMGLASSLAILMAIGVALISFVYLRLYFRAEERLS